MQSIKRIILRLKIIKLGLSKLGIVYIPQKTCRESGQPSHTFFLGEVYGNKKWTTAKIHDFFLTTFPMKIANFCRSSGNPHFKTDPFRGVGQWGYCWPSSHEVLQSLWHDVAIAGEEKMWYNPAMRKHIFNQLYVIRYGKLRKTNLDNHYYVIKIW